MLDGLGATRFHGSDTLFEPFEIRSLLRHEIAAAEPEIVRLTTGQYQLLNTLSGIRRA